MQWRNYLVNALLLLVSSAVSFEILSYIATKAGWLVFNDIPWVYVGHEANTFRNRTQTEPWGPWRKPHSVDRHVKTCFDVVYKANNAGARDSDFSVRKTDTRPRYVLLGDSFAEGWTVDIGDTAQARLEKKLGVDIYNFGAAGFVGPVQYYLIYKMLAKTYDHDGVIVFFLPANDFSDNDFKVLGQRHPTWYRPYYRKEANGSYSTFYSDRAKPDTTFYGLAGPEISNPAAVRTIDLLKKYTYSANSIRTIKYLVTQWTTERPARRKRATRGSYSAYFDAPRDEQEAAVYFLGKIVDEAEGRKVLIVVIPDAADLRRIRQSPDGYADQYWYQSLKTFERTRTNVQVLDLAPRMTEPPETYFQTCDSHWNAFGNAAAADIIAPLLGRP